MADGAGGAAFLTTLAVMTSVNERLSQRQSSQEKNQGETTTSVFRTVGHFLKSANLEVFYFVFIVSIFMKGIVAQNLIIEKVCRYELNLTSQTCDDLTNLTLKAEVQRITNNYGMIASLIEFVPSALVALLIGQWSDKYSRKLQIYLAIGGKMIENLGLCYCAYYMATPVYYQLLVAIPVGLSGSVISLASSVYAIATETSTPELRTVKYAALELMFGLATPLGYFIAGQLFLYSYIHVFLVGAGIQAVSLLWFVFMVGESHVPMTASFAKKVKDFFDLSNFKNSFLTCLKKRPNYDRLKVILLIISTCFIILDYIVFQNISYLFTNYMYGWKLPFYTNVTTGFSIFKVVSTLGTTYFLVKRWHLSDPLLGIIGTISQMLGTTMKALAFNEWMFYGSHISGMLGGLGGLAVRSCISKIVAGDELGQIFAFLAAFENLVPLGGVILFTQVYNASLSFFPGMVYLIITVLSFIPLAVFIWILIHKDVENDYEVIEENETPKETDQESSSSSS